MVESDFSWTKFAIFFIAIVLLFLAFVLISLGLHLFEHDFVFYGIASIIGGINSGLSSALVYKYYQNKTKRNK